MPKPDTEFCGCCYFWFGNSPTQHNSNPRGRCRIASVPGPFPERFYDEWCGEFAHDDVDEMPTPGRRLKVVSINESVPRGTKKEE